MIALLLLVGFLSVQPLSSARLPSVWCVQIADLCSKFETSPTSAVVTNYTASNALEIQDPMLQLMPSILLWAPLEQFTELLPVDIKCPKCIEDNNTLVSTGWRDGTGSA